MGSQQTQKQQESHVVVFPFMAQGHTLPLLYLSKLLARRGIQVTVITTPSNAPTILSYVSKQPNIHLRQIPFPSVEGIPKGCENTADLPSLHLLLPFLHATKSLQQPFHQFLQNMSEAGRLPTCVISDFFLGWTLATCGAFGIPRLVFHGMGALSMAISKTVWVHQPHLAAASDSEPLTLPGLKLPFTLTSADLPAGLDAPNHDDPFSRFLSEAGEAEVESWGVIVNSFVELERPHVQSLEAFYRKGRAWCVGPLRLHQDMQEEKEEEEGEEEKTSEEGKGSESSKGWSLRSMEEWLRERAMPAGSVMYVAFGTQAEVCDEQLEEVVAGLDMSGYSYLLVVRSKTWTPQLVTAGGLIVREWIDQGRILGHPAIGGFLSHCGWNSVLESLSAGVPILAWPMIAEQTVNAKLVVEGLGAGVWVKRKKGGIMVGREAIRDGVRELMGGEKGLAQERELKGLGEQLGALYRREDRLMT